MIKARIYIHNENTYMDHRVNVDVKLPAIPRKGEMIFLDEYQWTKLEDIVNSNKKITKDYLPMWQRSKIEPNKVDFLCAMQVHEVQYRTGCEVVDIELTYS